MPAAVVIQTSFLGDVVLTTPLLAHLAARDAPVTVVTTPAAAELLEHHPAVSRVVPYDKRGRDAGLGGLLRVARAIRTRDGASIAYLAQGSHRSAALARFAGFRQRVGFVTAPGRLWYTKRVRPVEGSHHTARLLQLACPTNGVSAVGLRPSLYPPASACDPVDRLLTASGSDGAPLVALAPGSVWATKRWPGYPSLAAAVSALGRVVILGSSADRVLAQAIVERVPDAIDATGQLSLLASAELLRRAKVLVTNDSLPLHLASAMNTPTVALFGPTVEAFGFGPLADRRRVLGIDGLECRPCHAHGPARCPRGHFRCMRDLAPEVVAAAVRDVLHS